MEMKQGLNLRQTQQLIITPRLQQALKILQMPMLELQQMLKEEILVNPILEEVDEVLENKESEEVRFTTEPTESDGQIVRRFKGIESRHHHPRDQRSQSPCEQAADRAADDESSGETRDEPRRGGHPEVCSVPGLHR